jgi:GT2 family glycosyltransferase
MTTLSTGSTEAVAVGELPASINADRRDGRPAPRPHVSVTVPTYREVENLPFLIDRIAKVRQEYGLDLELLIVDDDSRDGTVELVASRPEEWLRLIVRTADRGLSLAVLEGLRQAANGSRRRRTYDLWSLMSMRRRSRWRWRKVAAR